MRPLLLLASAVGLFAAEQPVTFLRDVAPILNKAGCTSGPCHGAAKGKNGFKLSLRGYDPQFDYEALLYDLSGRRFNRAEPGRSLMLAKPTQQVPHGGGLRFDKDSDYYKTIYNWIAQGVPFGDPAKDSVTALEVEPREIAMPKPGETATVKVVARFADGKTRDVTREATVESNTPDDREGAMRRRFRASVSAKPHCLSAIRASCRRCRLRFSIRSRVSHGSHCRSTTTSTSTSTPSCRRCTSCPRP